MSVVRRFLVAPSLVRLIRKERGGSRVTEGYFAPQAGRTSFVRIDGQDCHLILVKTDGEGCASEERTEVPRAHGDALLDVCPGKAAYDRTTIPLGGGRDALIDRYVTPAGLTIASISFDDEGAARAFAPPAWFGKDVSSEPGYDRHAVALGGVPASGEVGLTNAALDAVLDLIEPRFGLSGGGSTLRRPVPEAPKSAAVQTPPPAPVAVQPEVPAVPPPPPVEPPAPPPEPEPPKPVEVTPPPPPEVRPVLAEAPAEPPKAVAEAAPSEKGDAARIDDVIESLSAALSAAIQQPREPARDEETPSFERWTVRPRRTNQ